MTTIAFFLRHFGERATEVSSYDYAHFNETLLGNESIILSLHPEVLADFNLPFLDGVYERFSRRFPVAHARAFGELASLIAEHHVDVFYTQTHGGRETAPFASPEFDVPSIVHCVFDTRFPQGTIYAAISESVNEAHRTHYPVVPYIVHLPETDEDLRAELNIPAEAIVFGRYGGHAQFDIDFVREVVVETALRNDGIHFLFMNTDRFCEDVPNIRFLPARVDPVEKRKFVNSCDAFVHGRRDGETFGLACGEFAICGKPVIAYEHVRRTAHIKILGDQMVLFRDRADLKSILEEFSRGRYSMENNGYMNYSPQAVMQTFRECFIPDRRAGR
jgi:hypothetical protein